MFRKLGIAVTAAMVAGLVTSAVVFAEKTKPASLGDKAPVWKDLEGTDGKKHSLADLDKAKAVLVVFTCNHCPVAVAYEDRLVKFAKEFKDKNVPLVAINVQNGDADKMDKMKERAKQKGFDFQYLYDPSQKIGREYGAKVTPHCYVLDADRKIAYVGAFDDNQDPKAAKKQYVNDAVNAILAKKKPEPSETKPVGCGIGYE
jgi:peroxiredoxin